MENSKKPVYPIFSNNGDYTHESEIEDNNEMISGLTKLEYFAIHSGITYKDAHISLSTNSPDKNFTQSEVAEYRAKLSVLHAKSLLKELQKDA